MPQKDKLIFDFEKMHEEQFLQKYYDIDRLFVYEEPEELISITEEKKLSYVNNFSDVKSNQILIIDLLRNLSDNNKVHYEKSASRDQVESLRTDIKSKLRLIHNEFRKNSLRHRVITHATLCVCLSTILVLADLILGRVIIASPVPQIILIASILFWFLARLIPTIEPLPEVDE